MTARIIDPATVASVQTIFSRSRLSRTGWKSRLNEGRVDSRNVWRNDGRGSVDIFKDRRAVNPTVVNLWLLVDASGSMHGSKADNAADISATLVEAFKRVPSVNLHVWQHDFQYATKSVRLFRVYEPGRSLAKFETMPENGREGNADGFALQAIGDMATRAMRPTEKTIIVVISDGMPTDYAPNATRTGSRALLEHSAGVATGLRRKGVPVYCVAIERTSSYAHAMYQTENVIPFHYGDPEAWNDLARGLADTLGRTLR